MGAKILVKIASRSPRLRGYKSGVALDTDDLQPVYVLVSVEPVAGPNWTALEATLHARYKGGEPSVVRPQARSFWTPPMETSEAALLTRWNGQLYSVIGGEAPNENGVGRWQLRLWWKPFVTWIWYGGVLIAFGGLLALIGRLRGDLKRRSAQAQIALRKGTAAA